MNRIKNQFERVILDVFAVNNKRAAKLTLRKTRAYEKFFFLGYRACLITVMKSTDLPEDKAHDQMEELFTELDRYFPKDVGPKVVHEEGEKEADNVVKLPPQ